GRSAYRQPDVLVVVRSAIPLDIAHIDVHTGPLVDRNVDHPLPGGTANWGCFRLITTQNRLVKVDFDRRWSLSGGNGRFRLSAADFGRYQPREKEEEGEEEEEKGEHGVWCCSPDPFARVIRHLRAISSPRTGRKNVATPCSHELLTGMMDYFLIFVKTREHLLWHRHSKRTKM
ncbi:hypothetical protein BHM03_00058656, partial [Ensete ventricosum]